MWRRRFLTVGGMFLVLMVVGAIASIAAEWPAQFGGKGSPDEVVPDFLAMRGTALAPPLAGILLFGASVALARREDRWGTVGVVGAMLLGAVFAVFGLGEVFAASSPDVPRAAQLSNVWVGIASVALLVSGGGFLRERARTTPVHFERRRYAA